MFIGNTLASVGAQSGAAPATRAGQAKVGCAIISISNYTNTFILAVELLCYLVLKDDNILI